MLAAKGSASSSPLGPSVTTDDQVILTAAGNVAPIIQRGSRRLAAGGPHRTRSLRRVASETDLSEAGVPSEDTRAAEADIDTGPLTVGAARSRETSRDFTFAGGISPPQITTPPPGYLSPTTERSAFATAMSSIGSSYHTPQAESAPLGSPAITARPFSSPQTMHTAPASTLAGTAQPFSSAQSMHTAQIGTPHTTARDFASSMSMHTAQPSTPMSTARAFSPSGSMYTAPQSTAAQTAGWSSTTAYMTAGSHGTSERTAIPTFALTGPTPSTSSGTAVPESGTSVMGTARTGTQYSTARDSAYSTALGGLMSAFDTADDRASGISSHSRGSASTYDTAPPPVPSRDSRYGTASLAPSSPRSAASHASTPTASSLRRWQLHDAPVPSVPSAYETALSPPTEYPTAQYPSEKSVYTTATLPSEEGSFFSARPIPSREQSEQTLSVFKTASAKSPSEYSTAPPPPVSKSGGSIARSEAFSWRSDIQEDAETATRVSDTTDLGLIADLERNSSSGSSHSLPRGRSQYETAQAWSTVYGTAPEGTMYGTAHETVYQTANDSFPSYYTQSTYMTTAQGTQE